MLFITEKVSRGRRLKTKTSRRVIPIHAELVRLGFLQYADEVRSREGVDAWLFQLVAPVKGKERSSNWSKWFGRYLRAQGVTDTAKVFRSFRHGVNDALRRGRVDHELREALIGHSSGSKVDYGAKQMLTRWGAAELEAAVSKISYPGLNLSGVPPFVVGKRTRNGK